MSATLSKMAPTAIVFTLVVWCCWPYLEGPRQETEGQQADLPRIGSSLLSPTVEPAPDRNPFQPLHANQPDPPVSEKPVARPPEQPPAPAKQDSTDIFQGLVLRAIYIQGDRRVALINDRVYAQGESLVISADSQGHGTRPADGRVTDPCVVANISADKVLLLCRGRTVELKYAGLGLGADATLPPEGDETRPSKRAGEQRHE
jgi:hypothetical protein